MYDYIAVRIDIDPTSETVTDLYAAFLADIGYDSFVPDSSGLTAYIRKDIFNEKELFEVISSFPIQVETNLTIDEIKGEDWNSEWEKNYFKPLLIDNRCLVRSSFHETQLKADYEILIDPKMAFGTGHHQTTSGIISLLLEMNLKNKSVIDMGTGTGILSILCKKMGATDVNAIEIDKFAYENAIENGDLNNVKINWLLGDVSQLEKIKPANVFIANINRNVILEDIPHYINYLNDGGYMILSGFYHEDLSLIEKEAKRLGLELNEIKNNDNWIAVKFLKP